MPEYPVLREAEFDPKVKSYFMISTLVICVLTVVLIPIVPLVLIFGFWLIQKYLDNLRCTLTERTMELRRGVLSRVESTIPLEKITDLQMYQGPIMRAMGLYGFKVETAGQTTAAGSLMSIVGIVDAPAFRQAVLEQRDAMADGRPRRSADASPQHSPVSAGELAEIRDAVLRIERLLERTTPGDR